MCGALAEKAKCGRAKNGASGMGKLQREIHFPTSGPDKGKWILRLYSRLCLLQVANILWKGELCTVDFLGDFTLVKKTKDGGERYVAFTPVSENKKRRARLSVNCSGLQPGNGKIHLHRLYYFLVNRKYAKDAEGWAAFCAEGKTLDHKKGAWWMISRRILRKMSKSQNSASPKSTRKPGSFRPRV